MIDAPPTTGYTLRELPPEEWDKLSALPFGTYGLPPPSMAAIIVGETGAGDIVGVWAAITAVHLEGLWIRDDHQKTTLASRLLKRMKQLLRDQAIRICFTMIDDPDVTVLALKGGFQRVPGDLYLLATPPEEP